MRKYKSVSIIILSIVAFAFASELLRRKVGSFAGFYPFAEKWKIDAPIDSVKKAIVSLKQSNPDLFPTRDSLQFESDNTNYYLKVDFYYKDSKEIVRTLLRGRLSDVTTLTLVDFVNSDKGEIKKMNRDFNFFDNRKQIKKFDSLIYDKIVEELKLN